MSTRSSHSLISATLLVFLAFAVVATRARKPFPVPLKDSLNKWFQQRWQKASTMVLQEQAVEDYNGDYIARSPTQAQACQHRRLIALPLTEVFDPPMGVFSHGHVQTGDKVSLPQCFSAAILLKKAEVPWLVSISRIPPSSSSSSAKDDDLAEDGDELDDSNGNDEDLVTTPPRVQYNDKAMDHKETIAEQIPATVTLNSVLAGPLDFRAPSSYIFIPLWMMRALGIRPGEVVEVNLVEDTPAGSMAKLRPHSEQFAKTISNPQAVLETELKHYSSLTRGSTIAMDYNKQRYWFDVVDCKSAPKGESVPCIKVQDCDIATDFLPSREHVREAFRKKRQRQKEMEE